MLFVFALGLAALAATGAFASGALRLRSPAAAALAVYLLGWTEVVLLTQALSLVGAVGVTGYLVGEAVFLAGAVGFWHVRGRPSFPLPSVDLHAVRRHPLLLGLALVVLAAFCYEAFLVFAAPPNNADALSYRLSRAVAWLHEGGIHWIPDAHTARQNEFPPNGEIGVLYTFGFLHRDTAAALPHLFAHAALIVGVAGCARRLGFGVPAAMFAGLIAAMPAQMTLQSVSTQNDLLAASFVAGTAYFVAGRGPVDLVLAGLALGLGLGTKTTVFLVLPTLVLLALVSVPRRRLAAALAAGVAGFVLTASWGYARNVIHAGSPLGRGPELAQFEPTVTVAGTASTVARALYGFVDLSGFRIRTSWLDPIAAGGEGAFDALGIPPNPRESGGFPFTFTVNVVADENRSFFGPLGILLVVPLSLGFAAAWPLRRTTARRGVHGLSLPIAMLVLALTYRFSNEGRYLLPAVALVMPLAAWVYPRRLLAAATAVVAALTLAFAHAYNELKPSGLDGRTPVWRLSRPDAQGLEARGIALMIAAYERRVPPHARVGVVLAPYALDYPLYGPDLDRELVPLPDPGVLDAADRERLDWVFLGIEQRVPPLEGRWERIDLARTATLLRRRQSLTR